MEPYPYDPKPKKIETDWRPYAFALALGLMILAASAVHAAPAAPPIAEYGDGKIQRAIETELIITQDVPAYRIEVAVADGIVLLNGTVDSLLALRRAESKAEATAGVRSVVNRISVKPLLRPDDELTTDLKAALRYDSATRDYPLTVKADDGLVKIRGKVDSYAGKMLAEEVVAGVRGVKAVDNQIQVTLSQDRSDDALKREIDARLDSAWIDGELVGVQVKDGKVELSGSIGSATERTRAYHLSWVSGVQAVDHSRLAVSPWIRDKMTRYDKSPEISDKALRQAVKDAFVYDPRIRSLNPQVAVKNGMVTLTGAVDTVSAKRAAEDDARNTYGVWHVRNHLRVRPPASPSDSQIKQEIEAAVQRDPYVFRYDVVVKVRDGRVSLYGKVDSQFERQQAASLAESAEGALHVDNYLTVRETWRRFEDWEIRSDAKDQLTYNPFVDEDEVQITVDNGVATLQGEVNTWYEREQATDEALQAGARRVDNNLDVRYGPTFYD